MGVLRHSELAIQKNPCSMTVRKVQIYQSQNRALLGG